MRAEEEASSRRARGKTPHRDTGKKLAAERGERGHIHTRPSPSLNCLV